MPSWYDENAWYGSLLAGLFNFRASLSVLQVVAWFAYLVPTMAFFLRPKRPVRSSSPSQPVREPASV